MLVSHNNDTVKHHHLHTTINTPPSTHHHQHTTINTPPSTHHHHLQAKSHPRIVISPTSKTIIINNGGPLILIIAFT
jgi:hypothetical protein